ncbi:MAG: DNA repair protein RecO [Gemmiger sp.]
MQTATTGLVLRQIKVGEADQILTILTPDLGLVSASAKGSLRLKNRLFSACGLFCYSEFTLRTGRATSFVDDAQVKNVFHGLSSSVEGMSLAMYLSEITQALSPAPPEAEGQLKLLLNCLYMISENKKDLRQIKSIYELRAMTLAGFMPDILACKKCGKYDGGAFYFGKREGQLLCADCAKEENRSPNLDAGSLYAVRHICLAEDKKLFAFTLSPQSQKRLSIVSEEYLLAHVDHELKSLSFLKNVMQ